MLVVIGPFPPPVHGASRVAELVTRMIAAAGHEVRIIDTSVPAGTGYHLRRAVKHVGAIRAVFAASRRGRAVVYQTGAGGAALWYQAALVLVSRLLGVPQVFHHHSFAYLARITLAMKVIVRLGGEELLHVVLAPSMQRRMRSLYHAQHVTVLPNAALLGPPVTSLAIRQGTIVGHLSNLTVEKGVLVVLEAVNVLRECGVDARLLLAGPATDDAIRNLIANHMVCHPEDQWIGRIPPSEVPSFMRRIDVFLFPSGYRNEAQPLVVLEALREGTPVVATPVGCLPDLLDGTGWLVDGSVTDVASKLMQVMSNPHNPSRAIEIYSHERDAASTAEFVREVVGK